MLLHEIELLWFGVNLVLHRLRTALHRTHAPMAAIQSRAWRVARAHPISPTELLDVQTLAVTLIAPVARPVLVEMGVLA